MELKGKQKAIGGIALFIICAALGWILGNMTLAAGIVGGAILIIANIMITTENTMTTTDKTTAILVINGLAAIMIIFIWAITTCKIPMYGQC